MPFKEASEHLATSAHRDPEALAMVPAATMTATDATLSRIGRVMNLLLLARFSAASMGSDAASEHDRMQAELLGSALDEALAEQRILWFELAPTMATGTDGLNRYRDVTRRSGRPDIRQGDVLGSSVFSEPAAQLVRGDGL